MSKSTWKKLEIDGLDTTGIGTRGSDQIVLRCKIDGKQVYRKAEGYLATDKKAVISLVAQGARKFIEEAIQKEKEEKLAALIPEVPTVCDYIEKFIRNGKGGAETKKNYMRFFDYAIKPHFGKRQIDMIDGDMIDDWYITIEEDKGKDYAYRAWKLFKGAMAKAEKTGKLHMSPFRGAIERDKPPVQKETEPYTPDQIDAILNELSGWPLVWQCLLFGTGRRPSELMGLKKSDFNLRNRTIHIQRGIVDGLVKDKTKNGKGYLIDILPEVAAVVEPYLETLKPDDWLFTTNRGNTFYEPRDISDQFIKPVCDRLGIDTAGRINRGCRTTFGTLIAAAGGEGSLKWLQNALGHSVFSTTMDIYAKHIRPSNEKLETANNAIFKSRGVATGVASTV